MKPRLAICPPNGCPLARSTSVARVIRSGKKGTFPQIAILAQRLKVTLQRLTAPGAWVLVVDVQDQPEMCRRTSPTSNTSEAISLEAYDRGRKFEDYRRIATLSEYVLIAQDKPHIEQFRKQADGQWLFTDTSGIENIVEFPSISCKLALAEIYEKVEFELS